MIVVRVELRSPAGADAYARMTAGMNRVGFSRTVSREDGTRFKLPTGEFRFAGDASVSLTNARDLAAAAVRGVQGDFGLLAMRVEEWTSVGLKVKVP